MHGVFEKIIEKLEEQVKIEESIENGATEGHAITHKYTANCMKVIEEFIKQTAAEYNNGWISCSERMPEVPEEIDDDECPEFNVAIKGADQATTLKCASDGTWFDDLGYTYDVIAWQPLSEPYQPSGNRKKRTNFDRCCESMETMAQIIDIAKIGWTKDQIMEWLQKEECEVSE